MSELDQRIRAAQVRLGWNDDKLKAELARHSRASLAHRMERLVGRLNRWAEREGNRRWVEDNSSKARRDYEQERPLVEMTSKQDRQTLSVPERIGRVLGQMSLLQENTRAAGYEPRVSGDRDEGKPVHLDQKPMVDEWAPRFVRLVKLAEIAVDGALGRVRIDEGDRGARITGPDYEGEPSELVALMEGVTEAYVRKCRRMNGLHQRDGRPIQKAA